MRRFRRHRGFAAAWLRWVILLSACAFLVARLGGLLLFAPLSAIAENEARLRAIDAVNRVVLGSVGNSVRHEDLITYEKDQQGRIAAYHVNTKYVNQIASEAAAAVRDDLGKHLNGRFDIPLGALSGSRFLGAWGPRIPVAILPIGSVTIDLKQEFQAEGINQTRHSLWLHAAARFRVILPLMGSEVVVTSDLPITDTVIIGPVPASFYGGNLGGVTVPTKP